MLRLTQGLRLGAVAVDEAGELAFLKRAVVKPAFNVRELHLGSFKLPLLSQFQLVDCCFVQLNVEPELVLDPINMTLVPELLHGEHQFMALHAFLQIFLELSHRYPQFVRELN